MPDTSTPTRAQVVDHTQLRDLLFRLFSAAGLSDDHAAIMGDTLVTADLRGVFTHGSDFAPLYLERLANGVDPHGEPRVVRDSGSGILVDAGNCLGHIAAVYSMRLALDRAAETTVAAVAVRGSNHCGLMAYYPMMALERDMIGIATTNAMADMPPWGGVQPLLGSCPLAAAVPAGKVRPLVLDVAFQASNPLKVRMKQELGQRLPDDWAVDARGNPTTDPERALAGWGAPVGRYRGVGLAIIFGALGALLPGASFGWQLGTQATGPSPGADGHFFLAINIAGFDDVEAFKARVDAVVEGLKASPRAAGVDEILMPGERASETAKRYRRDGIPLRASTCAKLIAAAERLGVDSAPLV
jgi:LDH2 family malate/lactate/ureidoglycolate dehydrogenase